MARPAKPMTPAARPAPVPVPREVAEVLDGAVSLDRAAEFLAISRRELDRVIDRGELIVVYHRSKPRLLWRHVVELLARQTEETRAALARQYGPSGRLPPEYRRPSTD